MSENKKDVFEELYLQQKRKSSILLAVTVVLAITTAGSLYWGFDRAKTNNSAQPPAGFENRGEQGFPNGGQMGRMDFTRFFNEDGSVKNTEVQNMVDRLPSGAGSQFLSRFKDNINQAAKDGKITQTQADALIKAFESAGGANES